MDHYYTTSDNVKLHYIETGDGPNTVVILPGMGCPASDFNNVAAKLGDQYKVFALDYRSHGESEAVGYGYHIERFSKDFSEMLEDAGIDKFHLIAHSMGNTVGWGFMEMFGRDRVLSYVLEEEAPCLAPDPAWTEDEVHMLCGNIAWPSFMPPEQAGGEFMSKLFHDHVNRDWREEVKALDMPVVIVMGTESHYTQPKLWGWLQENIEGSEFVSLKGGHNLHIDNEDGFVEAAAGFLGRQI